MKTEEIMVAIEKVADYAKSLGLKPQIFYVDDDNSDECVSDPEELIEETGMTLKMQVGLVLTHNAYFKGIQKDDVFSVVEASKDDYEMDFQP